MHLRWAMFVIDKNKLKILVDFGIPLYSYYNFTLRDAVTYVVGIVYENMKEIKIQIQITNIKHLKFVLV